MALDINVLRLGRKRQGHTRLLRVSLSLPNMISWQSCKIGLGLIGPVSQDQTLKQKQHLKDLQAELKGLKETGEANKTICYLNGVPRIVNTNPAAKN